MFGLFNKKKEVKNDVLQVSDKDIVAIADGELIDVTTVSDPVFAQKLMGESTAFRFTQDKVILCAPANGTLSVLFPTGHAFGVTMKDGTELLVHCGINTVEANGDGFKVLKTIARLFKEYKPAIFFGLIGTLFLIISLIFGIPVFVEYFDTGLVPRFPTLIFSGFMLIISILTYACGIILQVVVKKHRQLFELFLINTKKNK